MNRLNPVVNFCDEDESIRISRSTNLYKEGFVRRIITLFDGERLGQYYFHVLFVAIILPSASSHALMDAVVSIPEAIPLLLHTRW